MDFSFKNIYRQYLLCRANKRNTANALRFEVQQERNLLELKEELQARTYKPSRSVCFFAKKPKLREIFAAEFRDRIVHHILVDYLERIWEPIFIHDSYACRKGKGVHQGVLRLRQFIRKVTQNGTAPAYYLQLDIRNYFMTIDKDILFSLVAARTKDEDALWLSKTLIYHDCTADYTFKGDKKLLGRIPAQKTLFCAPENKGLPIGNLNSQFFANVYLNSLDQFVKHKLKCKYYIRYCDDFLLLSRNREELLRWRERIKQYLRESLLLELNPKRQRLQPISNGVDFLGYIVRKDYLLVRRRVVANLIAKLREYERLLVREGRFFRQYLFDEEIMERLAACLSSYLGHFKIAAAHKLCKAMWNRFPFLSQYLTFDETQRRLTRKYTVPSCVRRIYQQYLYYRMRFRGDILFFQVGRFIEFYSAGDWRIARFLGLAGIRANQRGARYGFPVGMVDAFLQKLLCRGVSVTVIFEKDRYLTQIKARLPVRRYESL